MAKARRQKQPQQDRPNRARKRGEARKSDNESRTKVTPLAIVGEGGSPCTLT